MSSHPTTDASSPAEPEDPALLHTLRVRPLERWVFGRFRLLRELGTGGMAVVWLARDERLRLEVALKFLPGLVVNDPEALRELREEITRGLQLTHTGIVRLYDLHEDTDEQMAAIAMEYVAGPTLAVEKARQPEHCFAIAEPLLSWTRELCVALHYMHSKGRMVHRDLKPSNLMLTAQGELRVADFGIAATLSESQVRSISGEHARSGTPAYMSPQQMKGRRPSTADDIYALGATLYELITSKPPFFRGNLAAIAHQIAEEIPPTLQARRDELGKTSQAPIPPEWEVTLAACLAKDPAGRPATVREVAERLGLAEASPLALAEDSLPAATAPTLALADSDLLPTVKDPLTSRPPQPPSAPHVPPLLADTEHRDEPWRPPREPWNLRPLLTALVILALAGLGIWFFRSHRGTLQKWRETWRSHAGATSAPVVAATPGSGRATPTPSTASRLSTSTLKPMGPTPGQSFNPPRALPTPYLNPLERAPSRPARPGEPAGDPLARPPHPYLAPPPRR